MLPTQEAMFLLIQELMGSFHACGDKGFAFHVNNPE
jgi:hypothetical protein